MKWMKAGGKETVWIWSGNREPSCQLPGFLWSRPVIRNNSQGDDNKKMIPLEVVKYQKERRVALQRDLAESVDEI